jgi:KTSC domain
MPSQVIRAFAYDADRHELTVHFTSGKVYVYSLVPSAVAAQLEAAPGKGAYFNAHVRDRYPFRKAKAGRSEVQSLREALLASR